jgi:eukaryotic-like serine/threonine-protein kinase
VEQSERPVEDLERDSEASSEEAVALAFFELSNRLQDGDDLSLEQAIQSYPQFENDIRELWGTMVVAQAVGKFRATEAAEQLAASHDTLDRLMLEPRPSDRAGEEIDGQENLSDLPTTFGDFELLEELGRGGMGVVYRARQISLNRLVALKLILRGSLATREERLRFRSEAESAACLDHPYITKVYQYSDDGRHAYLSMQLIEGCTLLEFLLSQPAPSVVAEILSKVASAIQYAHERGVLHRDLKPSNILIDDNLNPHVVDFGLAKHHVKQARALTDEPRESDPLTVSGAIVGTPAYMAPEAACGRRGDVGPASDIYSLGAILYYCLAGQAPFLGKSPLDTVLMVREQDPVPPRNIRANADRDLERVALKCLQKPVDLRYHSAGELASDLMAYVKNEPLVATSGRFGDILSRMFRETYHANVLENWGLLWMWHAMILFVACFATDVMYWTQTGTRLNYFLLWCVGFGTWAAVFTMVRRRMGPVTFIERQVAHVWAASLIASASLFGLESYLGLEPLVLAPMLGVISSMVFLVKAGMLSGTFYIQALVLFLTAFPMAWYPSWGHTLFGVVSAGCFFFPGLKYYRQRQRSESLRL